MGAPVTSTHATPVFVFPVFRPSSLDGCSTARLCYTASVRIRSFLGPSSVPCPRSLQVLGPILQMQRPGRVTGDVSGGRSSVRPEVRRMRLQAASAGLGPLRFSTSRFATQKQHMLVSDRLEVFSSGRPCRRRSCACVAHAC